eukprot:gene43296-57619_t
MSMASLMGCVNAWAAHAYAQFGDIRYPAGFTHFHYVNPTAPKRGEISLVAPLIAKGIDVERLRVE